MAAQWNKTTGFIPLESEVTVYSELVGEEVNMDSLWMVVTNVCQAEDDIYEVTDAQR
jgi:hypothetical protein